MATSNKKQVGSKVSKPKSRVGGSLLSAKKRSSFSGRKALIAAGLVAAVGLVVVAFSYAAAPPCTDDATCSAQVTKAYNEILHRAPDAGGMAFWTAKLKDKSYTFSGFENYLFKSSECRSRAADPSEDANPCTPPATPTTPPSTATGTGGVNANELTDAATRARNAKSNSLAKRANAEAVAAKKDLAIVKARYDAARSIASKPQSRISESDIATANANVKDAGKYLNNAIIHYARADDTKSDVNALLVTALKVASAKPRLSAATVNRYYTQASSSAGSALRSVKSAKSYYDKSKGAAKLTQEKYDNEQVRLAEEAARQAAQQGVNIDKSDKGCGSECQQQPVASDPKCAYPANIMQRLDQVIGSTTGPRLKIRHRRLVYWCANGKHTSTHWGNYSYTDMANPYYSASHPGCPHSNATGDRHVTKWYYSYVSILGRKVWLYGPHSVHQTRTTTWTWSNSTNSCSVERQGPWKDV